MRVSSWVSALALAIAACTASAPVEVVLDVIMANDWAGTDAVVEAVRTFEEEHPNTRVRIEGVQFEFMAERINDGVASGDPPDVVQFHAFAAGATGTAEPVDDLWAAHGLSESEFLPGTVEDVRWGDTLYGLPLDANALLLLTNEDQLAAAGARLEPGYTYADLRRAMRAIARNTEEGRAIGLPSSTWATYGWIRSNGGEVLEVDPDGTPTFTFDRPENIEALAFLGELTRNELAFPPVGRQGDRIDAYALFRSETTFMHASGSWDVAALEREDVEWNVGIHVMPAGVAGQPGTGGTVLGGSSLLIPRGSGQRELAFEFMLHLIRDHTALRLAQEEGRLPARIRVYDDPVFQTPTFRTFFQQMTQASPFKLESFPMQHQAFAEAVTEILQGEGEAREALERAQRRAEAVG